MIGASHGGFLTLEYALAYPQHLYGIIVGDAAAQWSHWGAMSTIKTALTDPRAANVDPDQLLRMMSGTMTSQEDMNSGFATIMPLYAVPAHLQDQVETNVAEALDGAIVPVRWLQCFILVKADTNQDGYEDIRDDQRHS